DSPNRKIRFKKEVEIIPTSPRKTSFLSIFDRKDKRDAAGRGRRGSTHPSKKREEDEHKSSCC
ncbi:unnamed protein product, partial [Candidula unifasciata]